MTGPRRTGPAPEEHWLSDADPVEQSFILMFRGWLDGPERQAELWNALAPRIGLRRAREILGTFEAFLDAVASGATRRLKRHATDCPCLGEDEALLAGIVRAAGRGDTRAATIRAAKILRERDFALAMPCAARLGRLLDEVGTVAAGTHRGRTLH